MDEPTDLQAELERAKESLKDVEENIKKVTGRDPSEMRFGVFPGRRFPPTANAPPNERNFNRFPGFGGGRRESTGDNLPPQKRRALGSAYSRLGFRSDRRRSRDEESGDEDELPVKPTVQSSVVAHPKEQKTRKDCIEEQKPDAKGFARNRRMFGLLIGTLQKFRTEEHVKKDKEHKRVEIEKKLEENAEKEREELKKERRELYLERKKRQAQLKRLEYKIDLVKQLDEWEAHHKLVCNFIQTKTKPQICYLPAKQNDASRQKLKESRELIEDSMAERRSAVEEEIRLMGKRRDGMAGGDGVDHGEGEGARGEGYEEGEPDEFSSAQPDFSAAVDQPREVLMDEEEGEANLDESKENFPMLIAAGHQQEEGANPATGQPVVEGPAVPPAPQSNVPPTDAGGGDAVATASVTEETAVVDRSADRDMDTLDQEISLAEKEFEPIYD